MLLQPDPLAAHLATFPPVQPGVIYTLFTFAHTKLGFKKDTINSVAAILPPSTLILIITVTVCVWAVSLMSNEWVCPVGLFRLSH